MARSWGFWTRYKLELLQRYLDAFTTTTKNRCVKRVYLDLFGGEPENVDRDTQNPIDGSARIALSIENPLFTHLRFFELEANATKLRQALTNEFPARDWIVYPGDSNDTIHQALTDLREADAAWAPTFAFIDPNGPHYTWRTLQALAAHKGPRAKTKVELWMLFPDPLFARLLPRTGDLRPIDNAAITDMFGDPQWHAVWKAKLDDEIDPAAAREEYVNLMRWRLEHDLGYRWTHQLEIRNTRDLPIYHMIFATDSKPGHDIMTHLYDQAATEFPAMAQEARSLRERLVREAQGQFDLFSTLDAADRPSSAPVPTTGDQQRLYVHVPPDEPRPHDLATCPYCS
ncbi:MAG: three-Cys-motif partner protein TcmP [Acidimicrobiales bacterium]